MMELCLTTNLKSKFEWWLSAVVKVRTGARLETSDAPSVHALASIYRDAVRASIYLTSGMHHNFLEASMPTVTRPLNL